MIMKNIIVAFSLCSLACNAAQNQKREKYDLAYLETLNQTVIDNFGKLQSTLRWTNGGEVLTAISGWLSVFKIVKEEVDCVPRFKNLAKASFEDISTWLTTQTDETINSLLKAVDEHKTLVSLIEWQNKTYPETLSKEDGFKRLVESAHWKRKYL